MIVGFEIARQIAGGKRTMIRLPAKGKDCPYKPGKAYVVKTSQTAPASCHITVDSVSEEMVERQRMWVIRFRKGDRTDRPRLLASRPGGAEGDYTAIPARAVRGEGEAVSDTRLKRYIEEARAREEGRSPPDIEKMRERERRILREKRALERERKLPPRAVVSYALSRDRRGV